MTDNNTTARELVKCYLDAQKALYDFIRNHPEICVYTNPDTDLNFSHVGLCGHSKEPNYYRLADITLFGISFQICCCRHCGDKISFIPYPHGWEASPEVLGVPIQVPSGEVDKYIENCDVDNFNPNVGIYRNERQFASRLEYEVIDKQTPVIPISTADAGMTLENMG